MTSEIASTGKTMIQDDKGNTSSARILRLITNAVVLLVWAFCSIKQQELAEISWQVMAFATGANVIPTIQRYFENTGGLTNGGKN